MKTVYVIDACALIDAARNYNMSKRSFAHIWATIEDLIRSGDLISSAEIMDELKDDDLKTWAKQHKECFLPLTQEIQAKTSEVLAQFPTLIKIRSSGLYFIDLLKLIRFRHLIRYCFRTRKVPISGSSVPFGSVTT